MILFTKTYSNKAGIFSDLMTPRQPENNKRFLLLSLLAVIILLQIAVMQVSAAVRFVPDTPGPVTGQSNVCAVVGTGQTVSYSIVQVPGAEVYLWTVPATATIVRGQGTTSISVTFSPEFTGSANKVIKVRAISQEGQSPDRLLYLASQQPSTSSSIAGPSNACLYIGTSNAATYTIARNINATSYIWGVPAGAAIRHPNGSGIYDTLVLINFNSDYKTGQVTVQTANSCGFSAPRAITVSGSAPSTPGLITGPTNACSYMLPNGTTATYSISAVTGASSYTWKTPNGCIENHPNGPGVTDLSIDVQFPANFSGGSISVIANSGCEESAPRSLSIFKSNPGTPGNITAIERVICPDREYSYALPAMPTNANAVNWTVPAEAIGFSGQGGTSISVLYSGLHVNGLITATAVSNCASSSTRSYVVNLGRCQEEKNSGLAGKHGGQTLGGTGTALNAGNNAFGKISTNLAANAKEKMEINVAPNPGRGQFKLEINSPDKSIATIKLLDLQGRELKKMTSIPGESIMFGNELKPGSYILEVKQGKDIQTMKIMKL